MANRQNQSVNPFRLIELRLYGIQDGTLIADEIKRLVEVWMNKVKVPSPVMQRDNVRAVLAQYESVRSRWKSEHNSKVKPILFGCFDLKNNKASINEDARQKYIESTFEGRITTVKGKELFELQKHIADNINQFIDLYKAAFGGELRLGDFMEFGDDFIHYAPTELYSYE